MIELLDIIENRDILKFKSRGRKVTALLYVYFATGFLSFMPECPFETGRSAVLRAACHHLERKSAKNRWKGPVPLPHLKPCFLWHPKL